MINEGRNRAIFNKTTAKDAWNIRDYTIKQIHPLIDEYYLWYRDHGLHLPEEFATDPSSWTTILFKIHRAFAYYLNREEPNNMWKDAELSGRKDELWPIYEKDMQEGFELFGKYLLFLQDDKKNHSNA